jgi:hypothetical protein
MFLYAKTVANRTLSPRIKLEEVTKKEDPFEYLKRFGYTLKSIGAVYKFEIFNYADKLVSEPYKEIQVLNYGKYTFLVGISTTSKQLLRLPDDPDENILPSEDFREIYINQKVGLLLTNIGPRYDIINPTSGKTLGIKYEGFGINRRGDLVGYIRFATEIIFTKEYFEQNFNKPEKNIFLGL